MFVQHAGGESAVRRAEVRQRLRGRRRGMRLRGAGGKVNRIRLRTYLLRWSGPNLTKTEVNKTK